VQDVQLNEFFENNDITYPYQPWKTERWKDRRDCLVDDECEFCGSNENLQVHHEENGPNWRSLWTETRNKIYFSDYYKPEKYEPHTAVCPKCLKGSYRGRVTKEPTYVCENCGCGFDEPLLYPRNDAGRSELWKDITSFVENNAQKITDEFKSEFWDGWEAYFEGEDTITLCRGCHHLIH
jgi:hypothetical protein